MQVSNRPEQGTAAAANASLFNGEVISALLCAGVLETTVSRGTFSTCAYLDKGKYFCLGFLDSFLCLSCCTEILGVLQVFCRVSLH